MNILKEGKGHKAEVYYMTCEFCDSELRIINGDPRSYNIPGCAPGRVLKFVCPICHAQNKKYPDKWEYDELLTVADKEEMETWEDDKLEDLTDDDLKFLDNGTMWSKHGKLLKERHEG